MYVFELQRYSLYQIQLEFYSTLMSVGIKIKENAKLSQSALYQNLPPNES